MIDRRTFLGSATAASLMLPTAAQAARSSLDGLARRSGLRFGSCLGGTPANAPVPGGSFDDPRYRDLVAAQCGLMTPENELKWMATRPSPDRFEFRAADALVDWAVAHDIEPRGHTLLWHREERFPAWVAAHDFGSSPRVEAERVLTEHVRTVAGRYANRIHSFDVVNETVESETGVLRETTLSKAFGGTLELVDCAFRTAREAAPHAELVYNDYMSWEPGFVAHRTGVLRLLEALRKRGTPVDTLGVQSHIGAGPEHVEAPFGGRQDTEWRRFLDEVTGMGFKLLITEFDVDDRALPPDPALRDHAVADYARAYCDTMFGYPQLTGFVAWGLVDRYSWLQHFRPRADTAPKRPNPYDDAFRPKPLHDALAVAFRARRT